MPSLELAEANSGNVHLVFRALFDFAFEGSRIARLVYRKEVLSAAWSFEKVAFGGSGDRVCRESVIFGFKVRVCGEGFDGVET